MRAVALVCVFIPVLAWAKVEPASFIAPPIGPVASQPPAQSASQCAAYVPASMLDAAGATVLSAHLMVDGSVRRSNVVTSSGRGELDRAASACVQAIRFVPKTQNGIPLDVDWQLEVDWPTGRVRTAGESESCTRFYPSRAKHARREGNTLVSFVIADDGRVNDVSVSESSGDRDLDAATVACVSGFRYLPATHDGKPVAIDGTFIATWRAK